MTKSHTGTISSKYIAINSLLYAASQFFLTVWVAKIYGVEALGIYALLSGFFAPVLSFLSSGQRFSLLVTASGEMAFANNLALRFAVCFFAFLFVFFYQVFLGKNDQLFLVVFFCFYKIFDSLLEVFLWESQRRSNSVDYFLVGVLRALAIPLAGFFSFVFSVGFDFFVFLCCVVCLFAFFLAITRLGGLKTSFINFFSMVHELRRAFLPGLAAGVESLAVVLPRFYLAFVGDLEAVGAYVVFMQIVVVAGILGSSAIQSDMPRFSQIGFAVKSAHFVFFKKMVALVVLAFLVVYFLPSSVYGFVFGGWFESYSNIVLMMPFIVLFSYGGSYVANLLAAGTSGFYLLRYSCGFLFLVFVALLCSYFSGWVGVWSVLFSLAASYLVRYFFVLNNLRQRLV